VSKAKSSAERQRKRAGASNTFLTPKPGGNGANYKLNPVSLLGA
jgi:hypothetical protein